MFYFTPCPETQYFKKVLPFIKNLAAQNLEFFHHDDFGFGRRSLSVLCSKVYIQTYWL